MSLDHEAPFLRGVSKPPPRCEHPDHNEPNGCGNPECWKYARLFWKPPVAGKVVTAIWSECLRYRVTLYEGRWMASRCNAPGDYTIIGKGDCEFESVAKMRCMRHYRKSLKS